MQMNWALRYMIRAFAQDTEREGNVKGRNFVMFVVRTATETGIVSCIAFRIDHNSLRVDSVSLFIPR
jgi:hypothetical protein